MAKKLETVIPALPGAKAIVSYAEKYNFVDPVIPPVQIYIRKPILSDVRVIEVPIIAWGMVEEEEPDCRHGAKPHCMMLPIPSICFSGEYSHTDYEVWLETLDHRLMPTQFYRTDGDFLGHGLECLECGTLASLKADALRFFLRAHDRRKTDYKQKPDGAVTEWE